KEFKAGVLLDEVRPEKIKEAIHTIEKNYTSFSENSFSAGKEFDFKRAFKKFEDKFTKTDPPQPGSFNDLKNFKVRSYFTRGHERSVRAKKNILVSLLIKCFSIVISFLLIPLALDYLNPVKYG